MFNSRMEKIEERVSELEDRAIELSKMSNIYDGSLRGGKMRRTRKDF